MTMIDTPTAPLPVSWLASEPSDKILPAFVKALGTMEDIVKTKNVNAGSIRYTYADLADVLDSVRPELTKNGLAQTQVSMDDGVHTTLWHESGQWIEFAPLLIAAAGGTPQQKGSAITYARRYSILSIFGLATEDDDGQSAAKKEAPAPAVADPKKIRIDTLVETMKGLPADAKEQLKEWAHGQDRSLTPKALAGDIDWLAEVEAFIDEVLGDDDEAMSDETWTDPGGDIVR